MPSFLVKCLYSYETSFSPVKEVTVLSRQMYKSRIMAG